MTSKYSSYNYKYDLYNIVKKDKDIDNKYIPKLPPVDLDKIVSTPYPKYNFNNISKIVTKQNNQYNQNYRPIMWGGSERTAEPRAYIQPTPAEVRQVIEAIHMIADLPASQQKQVIEATREIRYFFDGQIRARFGATNHFNAIRCLNDPQRTSLDLPSSMRRIQLAGEEYFGLNRFMASFPDIADIQWWSLYQNGSWQLDTWNPQGEHLDTGINGWGDLVGSVLKVNGKVLEPEEAVALYRTIKLRNERGFPTASPLNAMQQTLRLIESGRPLSSRHDAKLEELNDLNLVDSSGKILTYIGQSMITPTTALQRRSRQETESDPEIKRIIHPLIFN